MVLVRDVRGRHQRGGFFFSSRRRHTRYIGDWSSDVCSSDLPYPRVRRSARPSPRPCRGGASRRTRSEERRVGKECRTRWETDSRKKRHTYGWGVIGLNTAGLVAAPASLLWSASQHPRLCPST